MVLNEKVSDFGQQHQQSTEMSLSPTKFRGFVNIQNENLANPFRPKSGIKSAKNAVRKSLVYTKKAEQTKEKDEPEVQSPNPIKKVIRADKSKERTFNNVSMVMANKLKSEEDQNQILIETSPDKVSQEAFNSTAKKSRRGKSGRKSAQKQHKQSVDHEESMTFSQIEKHA